MSCPGATVTVVVAAWDDYVEFLGDAVESVRRNEPEAPIVVVDNSSSEPVPELEGCTIVRAPRRLSEGAARNLGIERVATEFVVVLDADDMLLPGTLKFLYERIAADARLVVCASAILEGETGERFHAPRRFVARLARWPRMFALADSIWSLLPIQGCAILRTEHVRAAGGYADTDVSEDWDLAVSLAWRGRVETSSRLGLYYRPPHGSHGRRARTPAELRASARRVRSRMRADSAVPAWARALLPLIAALQLVAIHLVRPAFLAARRLLSRRRSDIR